MTNFPNDGSKSDREDKVSVSYPESPVPSDAHLAEDELPFTAFGQFGPDSMDLRVFEQGIYWVNAQGDPFLLEEMSREYLLNVMNHLFNEADFMYVSMLKKYAVELMLAANNSETGKLPPNHHAVAAAMSIQDKKPVEWLNSTPLVRKLSALLGW